MEQQHPVYLTYCVRTARGTMAASGDRPACGLRTAEWEHVQATSKRLRQQLREQLQLGPAKDNDRLVEIVAELIRLGSIQARLMDEYNAGQGAAGALRELWGGPEAECTRGW
ncbi:hypothetical protein OEZ86_010711 [Tetradesmus obliquus]|nr:hypothetical protein OEZ86_010711 [Tetradesmus obliquus]